MQEWITSLPVMMVVMLCIAVLPTFFQTNNARFFGLLCVGVRWGEVWDLLGKRNTSVSKYHPLVSIQRRLNNESRKPFSYRTFLSKEHQRGVTSAEEVVCCCCGWCRRFEIPTTQRFHRHFLIIMITQRWRTFFMVKVYLRGRFLIIMITRRWRTKK